VKIIAVFKTAHTVVIVFLAFSSFPQAQGNHYESITFWDKKSLTKYLLIIFSQTFVKIPTKGVNHGSINFWNKKSLIKCVVIIFT